MNEFLSEKIIVPFLSGNIEKDVIEFFNINGCEDTAQHSIRVSQAARELAMIYKVDAKSAWMCGLLHDTGRVLSDENKVELLEMLSVEILAQEYANPGVLHQKVSAFMVKDIFDIDAKDILSAVGCHSTLKKNPSVMDMILFISDKLSWEDDQKSEWYGKMKKYSGVSLEKACYEYIKYFLKDADRKVLHPWILDAYYYLSEKVCDGLSIE